MKSKLLLVVRSRVARIAVGPSTVRGRGNKGAVKAARKFLRKLDLRPFGTTHAVAFCKALDRSTLRLSKKLPRKARRWGIARKVINIFLRDALYTAYLRDAYKLGRAEAFYELPLDSITAKHLKQTTWGKRLSRWRGVKYVTPTSSDEYQEAAKLVALEKRVARVHLDAYWWSASRD